MLNIVKKTTLTTLAAMTLIGGLSTAANANTSLVKTNTGFAAQQAFNTNALNLNDTKLVNVGFKTNRFDSRREFKGTKLVYDKFGYNQFGYNRLGYNKRGFDRFGNSRGSNRVFGTRNFTRSKGFTNHIDSGSTFKNTKLFKSRF